VEVDPEASESEVVEAFRAEVGRWAPGRMPDLVELTQPAAPQWQRPVVWASGVGAAALAVMLLLSALLVLVHPAFPGSSELVERLSLVRP
jgi:hypothetical protein